MLTYQDFLNLNDTDEARMEFCRRLINEHKTSDLYKTAYIAEQYDRHMNVTIRQFQKLMYDVTGKAIADNYTANYKMASRFFNRFITQENQYLLGNGITWSKDGTAKKLGQKFEIELQKLGHKALWGGVSFGFWNLDHLEGFSVLEYAPLYDEEDGAMKAGVRFWQIDGKKPLRATLYELDGYTDYIWNTRDNVNGQVLHEKRGYIQKIRVSEADGEEIYDYENYPSFPIIPLWANDYHQSELEGLREQIDCYDLIKSGFANNVDEGSLIYWTLKNADGMDEVDVAEFIYRLKTQHAATLRNDAEAESHNLEAPYQSRDALLTILRADLYEDAMALDTKAIADGAITATQIRAGYENLNLKVDQYENHVTDFVEDILAIAGIDDKPTYTRSQIVNSSETAQIVMQAAQFLPEDYITRKMLTLLGDGDLADDIIRQMDADELDRYSPEEEEPEQVVEEEITIEREGTQAAQDEE